MVTFHTDEGFLAAIGAVNQAGQGETAGTHAMPLLEKRRRGGDRAQREKQTKLLDDEGLLMKILGHIFFFKQADLIWVITAKNKKTKRPREEKRLLKSHPSLIPPF